MDNATEDWLEVTMNQFEGKNMLPAQLIGEESFFIHVKKDADKRFKAWDELFKETEVKATLEREFQACDRVRKCWSVQNLRMNEKLYDAAHGSEFANFTFKRKEYRELFDF